MPAPLLRAADLTPGRTFELGRYDVTEEEIVEFARKWDPLPFHIDKEAAERGTFGGLIASGAHTIAIMIRLGSDGVMAKLDLIVGSAMRDLDLIKPVRPGASLTGHAVVLTQEADRPGRVRVWIRFTLVDDQGDRVMSMVGGVLVRP
jgi:acyl dehydratase